MVIQKKKIHNKKNEQDNKDQDDDEDDDDIKTEYDIGDCIESLFSGHHDLFEMLSKFFQSKQEAEKEKGEIEIERERTKARYR